MTKMKLFNFKGETMKKVIALSLILCVASYAIEPTKTGAANYNGATLDKNSAYAIVNVPKGRGVVGNVYIDSTQAQCQTVSTSANFFTKVCLLGKRESYDKVANIKVTKNVQVYEIGTIVYSKTKSSKTR